MKAYVKKLQQQPTDFPAREKLIEVILDCYVHDCIFIPLYAVVTFVVRSLEVNKPLPKRTCSMTSAIVQLPVRAMASAC